RVVAGAAGRRARPRADAARQRRVDQGAAPRRLRGGRAGNEGAAVREVQARGLSATSRPPSASYAGKRSAITGLTTPALGRPAAGPPTRRTPHPGASAPGFLSWATPWRPRR